MRTRTLVCFSAAFLALLLPPAWAAAAGLQVTPLRVHLSADSPAGALTLRNHGDRPRVIQAEVVRWTQEAGEDVHADTEDVLVTPPIFTLEPGESQVVRMGYTAGNGEAGAAIEQAYRIYLQESPPPDEAEGAQLQLLLRLGVPLFIAPEGREQTALQWTVEPLAEGGLEIRAANQGNVHTLIQELRVAAGTPDSDERRVATLGTHRYLLPGQASSWHIDRETDWRGTGSLDLSALTPRGALNAEIDLE